MSFSSKSCTLLVTSAEWLKLELNQKNPTSTSFPSPSNIATLSAPVAKAPTSTLPAQSSYPAFLPVLLTATLSNVFIAGPNVPCCPTGTWTLTVGATLDLVATVKFRIVVDVEETEVREGTTKAEVCTGNVMCEPWPVTLKCAKEPASMTLVANG